MTTWDIAVSVERCSASNNIIGFPRCDALWRDTCDRVWSTLIVGPRGGGREVRLHPVERVCVPFHAVRPDRLGPFVGSERGGCYI